MEKETRQRLEPTIPVWQDKNIPLSYAVSLYFLTEKCLILHAQRSQDFSAWHKGCGPYSAAAKFPFSLSSGSVRVRALLTKTNYSTEEDALPAPSRSLRLLVSSTFFCRYLHQLRAFSALLSLLRTPLCSPSWGGQSPKAPAAPQGCPSTKVDQCPSSPSAGASFRKPKETNAQEHGGIQAVREASPHGSPDTSEHAEPGGNTELF